MFQQCAPQWVDGRTNKTDNYGKYTKVQRKCAKGPPPSSADEICKTLHERITKIKWVTDEISSNSYWGNLWLSRSSLSDNETLDESDTKFIKQFLMNGTVVEPTESMLLPTDSLKKLNDLIRKNTHFHSHCFGINPGVAGWCATCRVRPNFLTLCLLAYDNTSCDGVWVCVCGILATPSKLAVHKFFYMVASASWPQWMMS